MSLSYNFDFPVVITASGLQPQAPASLLAQLTAAAAAQACLVIGTAGAVHPAAALVDETRGAGGRVVVVDPGETDPVATAVRELSEETGYEGESARVLGRIWSNPAILSNITCTVLIENCRLKHAVEFDHGEDLITRLVPVAEIPKLVADEKIGHSLVVVALYHFDLWQRGIKKA